MNAFITIGYKADGHIEDSGDPQMCLTPNSAN